jgi:phage tail sheath protein FI
MKSSFLFIMFSFAAITAAAQQKQPVGNDSLPAKLSIQNTVATRKTKSTASAETEINEKLNNLVGAYSNKPNTQAIWSQIISEAQNIFYSYYRNGKLLGIKPEQAYFVKMGNETMTPTDIANHKMILQAGIAIVKPAEFKIIIIEKINTAR